MSTRMDAIVAELWYCLPAESPTEIAASLSSRTGMIITPQMAIDAITYVRRHCNSLNWTIPPVKRGRSVDGRAYMRVTFDSTNPKSFDLPGNRLKLRDGAHGSLAGFATLAKTQADGLRAACEHTLSPKYKVYIEGLSEDAEGLSLRAERILKIMEAEG